MNHSKGIQLSVVIVNYNVKHFLEQCLISVAKAIEAIEAEVWVVDNNSVDGSCAMVAQKFPWVKRIENQENLGFSKANNQAMRLSTGKYVLLLNPDTLVQEDTFLKVVNYMDEHPDVGGLGVKMIDGKGQFLPESKRGLPTPEVAFYKIFGLAKLFPKNKRFGKYHLSFLSKDETHQVDILSGAFMLMRKAALDKVGLLDEAFFMYGEDIDLSYRIQLGGYKNVYFADTSIIHYKGESTKKSSVNYVFVFYRAMVIFAQKHFSQNKAKTFSVLINLAIYFRAAIAVANRVIGRLFLPVADAATLAITISILASVYLHLTEKVFDQSFYYFNIPMYLLIWMVAIFLSGGYDLPYKIWAGVRGGVLGLLIVLAVYALLPEHLRSSRLLVLCFGAAVPLILLFNRAIGQTLFPERLLAFKPDRKRVGIIGSEHEIVRVKEILNYSALKFDFVGHIEPLSKSQSSQINSIGKLNQLHEIVEIFKLDELIFCAKDVASNDIINWMSRLEGKPIEFKIAPPASVFVIGSNSINRSGEYYSILDVNGITKPDNKRNKWLFDKALALLLGLIFPLWFLSNQPFGVLKNAFLVFIGRKSWIGYIPQDEQLALLPKLKAGVLNTASGLPLNQLSQAEIHQLNLMYAKDYSVLNDIKLMQAGLKRLGGLN